MEGGFNTGQKTYNLHLTDSESFGYLVLLREMREVTHCVYADLVRAVGGRQTDRQAAHWKSLPGKSMELVSEQRRLQAAAADPRMAAADGLPFSPRSPLGRTDWWSSPSLISGKILNHTAEWRSSPPTLRWDSNAIQTAPRPRSGFLSPHSIALAFFTSASAVLWHTPFSQDRFDFHGCWAVQTATPLLPLPPPTPASYSWQTFENLGGSSWMHVCV